MSKPTITFYIPSDLFAETKLLAVKKNMAYTDLVLRCTLAMVNDDTFDTQKAKPNYDEKTMLYLTEDEKKILKTATAKYNITISELVCQALEMYAGAAENLSDRKFVDNRKLPRKRNDGDRQKKTTFSYSLSKENDRKLKMLCADTGKTRKQLIMESVKQLKKGQKPRMAMSKTARSSMLLLPGEVAIIQEQADKLKIGVFDLINLAIEQY